ncbi:MAG: hypothetical protein FWG66_07620 [Spirochaetes bacterium]|nr:hypothetical protein [Spirochaetota bacterium]
MKKHFSIIVAAFVTVAALAGCTAETGRQAGQPGGSHVEYVLVAGQDGVAPVNVFVSRINIRTAAGTPLWLTFHRVIERANPWGDVFAIYDVSIRIYGEDGNLVQEISGLQQNSSPFNAVIGDELTELSFIDLNFDGYLDLRLFSSLSSERFPMWGTHYHWLWDGDLGVFVFNEQLTEFLQSTVLAIDEESRTWSYGWAENAGRTHFVLHFAYINGRFEEARIEETNFVRIHAAHNAGDELIIHIDSHRLFDTRESGDPRMNHLRVYNASGELLQEMRNIRSNLHETFFAPAPVPSAAFRFRTIDLHFADYNNDGYLDMALAIATGGSMINSPRMYWLWDASVGEFVRNAQLERLSDESTVSVTGNGTVATQARGGGYWVTQWFRYEAGEFVRIE